MYCKDKFYPSGRDTDFVGSREQTGILTTPPKNSRFPWWGKEKSMKIIKWHFWNPGRGYDHKGNYYVRVGYPGTVVVAYVKIIFVLAIAYGAALLIES